MVAKTIGTNVSFAWETVAGQRPTTGYKKWCDCTAHPDLNPAREQVETTTLCQTNNKTYEDGLRDYGDLGFGSNLTNETMDLFIGSNGYVTLYSTKNASGLRLWVCIDIVGINKSYYVPVKPQDFGLPSGEAGSNKYDLTVNFLAVDDAGWFADPIYDTETAHFVTVNVKGSASANVEGATVEILGTALSLETGANGNAVFSLIDGTYDIKISKTGITTQYKEATVNGADLAVNVTGFNS